MSTQVRWIKCFNANANADAFANGVGIPQQLPCGMVQQQFACVMAAVKATAELMGINNATFKQAITVLEMDLPPRAGDYVAPEGVTLLVQPQGTSGKGKTVGLTACQLRNLAATRSRTHRVAQGSPSGLTTLGVQWGTRSSTSRATNTVTKR